MSSARRMSTRSLVSAVCFCFVAPLLPSPGNRQQNSTSPKYDLQTENKAKGVVDEVNVLDFGTRKDFIQLILKDESETVVVYVCPKPFEEVMGITFAKGDSFVYRLHGEWGGVRIFLAREIVKGSGTWTFRVAKENPV